MGLRVNRLCALCPYGVDWDEDAVLMSNIALLYLPNEGVFFGTEGVE